MIIIIISMKKTLDPSFLVSLLSCLSLWVNRTRIEGRKKGTQDNNNKKVSSCGDGSGGDNDDNNVNV